MVLILAAVILVRVVGGDTAGPRGNRGPAVGEWLKAPALELVRGSTSASTLADGRVLVAGGGLGSIPIGATELFNPRSAEWTASGSLVEARRGHRLVALDDGRLIVAGGIASGRLLASAEVFDGEKWEPAGEMRIARLGHTMTPLADGTVLVTGGTGEKGAVGQGSQTLRPVSSAEIFDPVTNRWSSAGGMLEARFEHTATLLPDGRVLIAGGLGTQGDGVVPLASAELYDPASGTFTRAGSLVQARSDHTAAILEGGRVLVVGGDGGSSALASAEIYLPDRGAWTEAAPLDRARRGHSATSLDDGSVLVAGGEFFSQGTRTSLAAAELYSPAADEWRDAGKMGCPRSEHGAALLRDQRVLIVGGDATFPGEPPIAQSCVDIYVPANV